MSSLSLGTLTVGVTGDIGDLKKAMDAAAKAADDAAKEVVHAGDQMGSGMDKASNKATGLSGAMSGLAGAITAAFSVSAIKSFVGKALEAEKTAAMMDGAFGDSATAVTAWSDGLADATGRSSGDIQKMASAAQSLLSPLIGNEKAAASMSEQISQLAIDMGSFYQVQDDEALQALQAGLLGNAKALRQFGVVMNDDVLAAQMLKAGVQGNVSDLSEAQKAQLRFNAIIEQTVKIQGHAAENTGSYTNVMAGLNAAVEDVEQSIGAALIPIITEAAKVVRQAADWFNGLTQETQTLAAYAVGAAGAAAALAGAIALVGAPLVLAVVGMAAAITAVGALRKAWEGNFGGMRDKTMDLLATVRDGFKKVFGWIGDKVGGVLDAVGEKLVYLTAMLKGMSPDEAGAIVQQMKAGGGLFDLSGAADQLDRGLEAGSAAVRDAIDKAPDFLKQGAGFIVDSFKEGLGVVKDGLQSLGVDMTSKAAGAQPAASSASAGKAYTPTSVNPTAPKESDKKEDKAPDKSTDQDAAAAAQFITSLGSQLSQAAGSMGQMVSVIVQAAMLAGPVGALLAGFTALAQHSESFQKIVEVLNQMVTDLAQALNPLFDAIMPLIQIIGNLVRAIAGPLSKMFTGMKPIFDALITILRPLLAAVSNVASIFAAIAPMMFILGKVLQVIAPLFEAVGKVLEGIAWVLKKVFGGIAWVFNGIIEAIAWVLEKIDDWIPGDTLSDWAKSMRKGKVDMDAFNNSIEDYNATPPPNPPTDQLNKFGDTLDQVSDSLENVPTGFKVTLARFNAALSDTSGHDSAASMVSEKAGIAADTVGHAVSTAKTQGNTVNIENMIIRGDGSPAQLTADAIQKLLRQQQFKLTGSTEGTYPLAMPRTSPLPAGA